MSITLDQVTKRYGGVPVVNDVSLDSRRRASSSCCSAPAAAARARCCAPSPGSPASITGASRCTAATSRTSPRASAASGFVFQNYALFRHMTVAENIEFALRVRRMRARATGAQRRKELLRLVALEGMDERLPAQLSGGQQQRVAVARALAHKPEVLLLDEPFGALDAKIREELRRTIRQVQRELGITTVLVTHDQEEAFALADRIGVMNLGRLLEMGAPARAVHAPGDALRRHLPRRGEPAAGAAAPPDGIQLRRDAIGRRRRARRGRARARSRRGGASGGDRARADARRRSRAGYLAPRRRRRGGVHRRAGAPARAASTDEQHAPLLAFGDGDSDASLRGHPHAARAARASRCAPGQQVAHRRAPRARAADAAVEFHRLRRRARSSPSGSSHQPLLAELAARMKTRIATRIGAAAGDRRRPPARARDTFVGTTVIAAYPDSAQQRRVAAAPRGARPAGAAATRRARRSACSSTGSARRRAAPRSPSPPACCATCPPKRSTSASSPDRRDAASAPARHARSCSMRARRRRPRTAWRCAPSCASGTREQQLARRLGEAPGQMLIAGRRPTLAHFTERFRQLLDGGRWPVLIVHRGAA